MKKIKLTGIIGTAAYGPANPPFPHVKLQAQPMKGQKVLFSNVKNNTKSTDEWETPQLVINHIESEGYRIILDLAATKKNSICRKALGSCSTKDSYCQDFFNADIDRLVSHAQPHVTKESLNHRRVAYCNPPYSQAKFFIEKIAESRSAVIMLLPARTDTIAFHKYIYKQPNTHIKFLRGRVIFEINGKPVLDKKGKPMPAPFPSMLVYFRC